MFILTLKSTTHFAIPYLLYVSLSNIEQLVPIHMHTACTKGRLVTEEEKQRIVSEEEEAEVEFGAASGGEGEEGTINHEIHTVLNSCG